MPALSPAQLAVLRAAADAPDVQRPFETDLKVGDTVVVSVPRQADYTAPVTKIGPQWITVGVGRGAMRFRRATWRAERGYGSEPFIRSVEQRDYDQRLSRARQKLRDVGIMTQLGSSLPDGHVLAFAALLDLLDEADAGRALLDTLTPEVRP